MRAESLGAELLDEATFKEPQHDLKDPGKRVGATDVESEGEPPPEAWDSPPPAESQVIPEPTVFTRRGIPSSEVSPRLHFGASVLWSSCHRNAFLVKTMHGVRGGLRSVKESKGTESPTFGRRTSRSKKESGGSQKELALSTGLGG